MTPLLNEKMLFFYDWKVYWQFPQVLCFGPAAAEGLPHNRETSGYNHGWISPGTEGSHHHLFLSEVLGRRKMNNYVTPSQDHLRFNDHNADITSSEGCPVCHHIPAGRPDTSAVRSWCSAFSWPESHSCPAVSRTARTADPSHGSTSPGQPRPPIRGSPSPASPSEKVWWKKYGKKNMAEKH